MKVQKIPYTSSVFFSSRTNQNENGSSVLRSSAKNAALLSAALLALAANARGEVIDTKKAVNEAAEKECAMMQYDRNDNVYYKEQKSSNMQMNLQAENHGQNKYEHIFDLLKPGEKLGSSCAFNFKAKKQLADLKKIVDTEIRKLSSEEIIELLHRYPNIINCKALSENASCCILEKLVDYRVDNISESFVPMLEFDKKIQINNPYISNIEKHVDRISQNKHLKNLYADNFAINYVDCTKYKYNTDLFGKRYRNIFIKLLLPSVDEMK